jgi:hypothetical protein
LPIDIGRGLGPLWVALLITGTGGRIPGFNLSIGGWFVCCVILFVMSFTVNGDFRKLEQHTQAAADRRRVGLAEGSLVTIKEVDAEPLEVADAERGAKVMDADAALESAPRSEQVVDDADNASEDLPSGDKSDV